MSHWIFLRGLVRESAHWDDFPAQFCAAIPGAKVHLIDLPGNGRHWAQASPLTLRETMEAVRADALAAMQARLGTGPASSRPSFYLFTISLGGMVAVEWASQYPEDLAGMVLINTSLRGLSPLHQRLSLAAWPLMARLVATLDVAQRERLILALTSAKPDHAPGLIETRLAIHQRHPVRLANVIRQLWAAASHHPPQAKPAVPLLLVNSLGDRMVAPECTQAIARRWGIEPVTHSWAGHDLPLDDPDWVIAVLAQWLSPLHKAMSAGCD